MAAVSDANRSSDQKDLADCEEEKRATHEQFTEIQEVRELIDSLKNVWNDLRRSEMALERFTYIVDDYQEQPHLIDPYLEEILMKLLTIARDKDSPKGLSQEVFKYMYLVTKMRGFKVVVRLLPHEVADMEPVLSLIDQQDPMDVESWQTRYMLLLWLSMVCMIPFDLRRLDSNLPQGNGSDKQPVMERILSIGKLYLTVNDKCRDAASYLLSHFLTRPDVKKELLPQVVDWNLKMICTSDVETMKGVNKAVGSLATLALLFKHGKREDLLTYASVVLSSVTQCNFMESNNTLLRKSTTKLIQRLGLIFLKHQVTAWRYQRGSRSLAENLRVGAASNPAAAVSTESKLEQEEEEFDIPEETEEVIGLLLGCLKDKDTVVRWSAAKGVGRVTGRLPKELADEVVGSVLELFSYQETDGAWHGGCLTLAELGRRGLLLPERLDDVVPIVLKALLYDERRGSYSVGSHVRDAACYVCWAFARAYDPKEIAPYVNEIANALVIVSIFDREVNVRRAAAAAFQENVGRQGTFPHGIDILTTVDYYAVGTRSHCYLDLSLFIAQFEEYTVAMIDHLVSVKVSHWDNSVRIDASKALHKLTVIAPEYMAEKALPSLLSMTSGIDLFQRHGAIIAAAEITHALFLHHHSSGKTVESVLSSAVIEGLQNIAQTLHTAKLFRGHSGELMKKAVCLLIEKLSLSKLPVHSLPIIDLWHEILSDCLSSTEAYIQAAAVSAIPAYFSEYYTQKDGSAQPDKQEKIISHYLSQLKASLETTRTGYSLALGALPEFMLHSRLEDVLTDLIAGVHPTSKAEEKMAEARRDVIKAISSVCKTVGVHTDGSPQCCVCKSNLPSIYNTLISALKDYTMDSRGDVGSWVREASMTALGELTEMVVQANPALLSSSVVHEMICGLIQQACEKIDRTRAVAGQTLFKLLYFRPEVPHIQCRAKLEETFPESQYQHQNWALPMYTFACFAKLLGEPTYTHCVLLGMTVSVGGLTESLVKHSSHHLLDHLKELKEDGVALKAFTESLLSIFQEYQKNDRVSIPLLKMLDLLLGRQCFDGLPGEFMESFPVQLMDLVKQEVARSGDPNKIMAAADVFCGMLQFPTAVCQKALSQLSMFLCHKYPRVRKATANKLYEAVLTYDEVAAPESFDEILTLLSETKWDEDVEQLRPVRNNLCDLFGISRPVVKKKAAEAAAASLPSS
ncbi:tubulin-specific chaperone D-like [Babylonia areolata]|uniref:tubulin-specific chaperone D-like n=1 Tax=Babylonia areolata TaxID=304850 RepID=UPI003FD36D43